MPISENAEYDNSNF
jgi:hypothetical protein